MPFKIVFAMVLTVRPAELAVVVGARRASVNRIVKRVRFLFFMKDSPVAGIGDNSESLARSYKSRIPAYVHRKYGGIRLLIHRQMLGTRTVLSASVGVVLSL